MSGGLDYCKLGDVLGILYAGMGLAPGEAAPADDTRDARLEQLITATSRDFDYEVQGDTRNTPLFAPTYDVRLYSGKGGQLLSVDPFLAVTKLEVLTNPGAAVGSQTWNDYTAEIAGGQIGVLPLRGYPKSEIFRQASFYVDPFPLGNVRLAALFGICVVDPAGQHPTPQTPGFAGLTQGQIDAMAPPGGGWYATPLDVVEGVASWVAFRFEAGKAVFAEQAGSPQSHGGNVLLYPKTVPADVQRLITRYKGSDTEGPKFALVNADGSDDETLGYRWAGWQTS